MRRLLYLVGALALSFAAYGTSLGGELVFDDVPLLVDADCYHDLRAVPSFFGPTRDDICALRPMRYASFAVDYALWHGDPLGYHLTNVLLHGVVAWLALLLLLRLGVGRVTAITAAGLFAVHPITSEAVAYVSGRRDLLMALFCLLAAHAYLSHTARHGAPRAALGLLALLCWAAAVLSHESAVALPVALLALETARGWPRAGADGTPGWRESVRRALRALHERRGLLLCGIMLAAAIGYSFWASLNRNPTERTALWGPSLGAHVGTVLRMHAHYLAQLALPTNLIADYTPEAFPASGSLFELRSLGAALVVALLLAASVIALRRLPAVSAAIWCYLALLLPTSQIVVHHEIAAEHRLYLPSLCFCLLLGGALVRVARRHRLVWSLVGAIALAYLTLANVRSQDWLSSLALWSRTVEQVPRCARAQSNLGAVLARAGKRDAARRHLQRALAVRPGLCSAKFNLGQLQLQTGQRERGLALLLQATRCKRSWRYQAALGQAYLGSHRHDAAAAAFAAGLEMRPDDPDLHLGLGAALHRLGRLEQALAHYQSALRRRPAWPKARYRVALLLARACRTAEAQRALGALLEVWPEGSPEEQRIRRQLRRCADAAGD